MPRGMFDDAAWQIGCQGLDRENRKMKAIATIIASFFIMLKLFAISMPVQAQTHAELIVGSPFPNCINNICYGFVQEDTNKDASEKDAPDRDGQIHQIQEMIKELCVSDNLSPKVKLIFESVCRDSHIWENLKYGAPKEDTNKDVSEKDAPDRDDEIRDIDRMMKEQMEKNRRLEIEEPKVGKVEKEIIEKRLEKLSDIEKKLDSIIYLLCALYDNPPS